MIKSKKFETNDDDTERNACIITKTGVEIEVEGIEKRPQIHYTITVRNQGEETRFTFEDNEEAHSSTAEALIDAISFCTFRDIVEDGMLPPTYVAVAHEGLTTTE